MKTMHVVQQVAKSISSHSQIRLQSSTTGGASSAQHRPGITIQSPTALPQTSETARQWLHATAFSFPITARSNNLRSAL